MVTVPSYHHGARPSDKAKLALTLPARSHIVIAAALASPLPLQADTTMFEPTMPNQGNSESCTCGSTSCGVFAAFAAIGMPGILPSMRYLYALSGLMEGPAPQDNGRQIADVMSVLQGGFPLFEGMSPDGRFYDIWTAADTDSKPPNVNLLPTGIEQKLATTHTTGQHTIDLTASTASDEACATLAAAAPAPLIVGSYVGNGYMSAGPDTVLDVEPVIAGVGGGHALRVSAFRTVAGQRQFLTSGSYGPNFGNKGRVWCTEAWLLNCFEAWPMTLSLKGGSLWNTPPDPRALDHLEIGAVKVSDEELREAVAEGEREAERRGFRTRVDWGKLMGQWLP